MVIKKTSLKHLFREIKSSGRDFIGTAVTGALACALFHGTTCAADAIDEYVRVSLAYAPIAAAEITAHSKPLASFALIGSILLLVLICAAALSFGARIADSRRELVKIRLTMGFTEREILTDFIRTALLCAVTAIVAGLVLGSLVIESIIIAIVKNQAAIGQIKLGFSFVSALISIIVTLGAFICAALVGFRLALSPRISKKPRAVRKLRLIANAFAHPICMNGSLIGVGLSYTLLAHSVIMLFTFLRFGTAKPSLTALFGITALVALLILYHALRTQTETYISLNERELTALRVGGLSEEKTRKLVVRDNLLLSLTELICGGVLAVIIALVGVRLIDSGVTAIATSDLVLGLFLTLAAFLGLSASAFAFSLKRISALKLTDANPNR